MRKTSDGRNKSKCDACVFSYEENSLIRTNIYQAYLIAQKHPPTLRFGAISVAPIEYEGLTIHYGKPVAVAAVEPCSSRTSAVRCLFLTETHEGCAAYVAAAEVVVDYRMGRCASVAGDRPAADAESVGGYRAHRRGAACPAAAAADTAARYSIHACRRRLFEARKTMVTSCHQEMQSWYIELTESPCTSFPPAAIWSALIDRATQRYLANT